MDFLGSKDHSLNHWGFKSALHYHTVGQGSRRQIGEKAQFIYTSFTVRSDGLILALTKFASSDSEPLRHQVRNGSWWHHRTARQSILPPRHILPYGQTIRSEEHTSELQS